MTDMILLVIVFQLFLLLVIVFQLFLILWELR